MANTSNKDAPEHKEFQQKVNEPVQINIQPIIDKKFKVLVATPVYGGMYNEGYHRALLFTTERLRQHRIPFQLASVTNESLVTRARNVLVSMFLNGDCTHLMFVDADITFNPDYIIKMLWDTLRDDVEIVVGAYPKKGINWKSIIDAVQSGMTDPQKIEGYSQNYVVNFAQKDLKLVSGLIELKDAGSGFMLIQRSALDKIIKKYGKRLQYNNDFPDWSKEQNKNFYAMFDTCIEGEGILKNMPGNRRYLSEDYFFCRLCQSLGIKIWYDPRINLEHTGPYNFKGSSQKLFSYQQKKTEPANTNESINDGNPVNKDNEYEKKL